MSTTKEQCEQAIRSLRYLAHHLDTRNESFQYEEIKIIEAFISQQSAKIAELEAEIESLAGIRNGLAWATKMLVKDVDK